MSNLTMWTTGTWFEKFHFLSSKKRISSNSMLGFFIDYGVWVFIHFRRFKKKCMNRIMKNTSDRQTNIKLWYLINCVDLFSCLWCSYQRLVSMERIRAYRIYVEIVHLFKQISGSAWTIRYMVSAFTLWTLLLNKWHFTCMQVHLTNWIIVLILHFKRI